MHPSERKGLRKCGAKFHTDDGDTFTCNLDVNHAAEHCGHPEADRWYWRDGDTFIRPKP